MYSRRIVLLIAILIVISIILASLSIMALFVPRANAWATSITQIDRLHALGFDGSDVTIGIIDSGIEIEHQEFDTPSFIAWSDLINQNSDFYDDDDHGTHLAGIIVSKGSFQGLFSGIHMRGIAIESKLIVVKSIPRNQYLYGGGNDSTIAEGIRFCIENEADIILLSMGMNPDEVNFIENNETIYMINQAIEQGIFVVVPAGNDGQDDDGDVNFPATLDTVISVGAISRSNAISSFSSKGHQYPSTQNPNKKPELVAPGEAIMSTRIEGAYGEISGTSQAAAFVAGIIALLLDAYPEYKYNGEENQNETTIQLFKEVFANTAKKIGNLQGNNNEYSHDDFYGYGLIQAFDAYSELAKY
jgi:subtilisin family serine protease